MTSVGSDEGSSGRHDSGSGMAAASGQSQSSRGGRNRRGAAGTRDGDGDIGCAESGEAAKAAGVLKGAEARGATDWRKVRKGAVAIMAQVAHPPS